MKQTKICPYCRKEFTTTLNAKKFCRKACAALASKQRASKKSEYLCQWCGQVFKAARRKKFCSTLCQGSYMKRLGYINKTEIRIPVKYTLYDIESNSRREGITYGKYVSLHKIKQGAGYMNTYPLCPFYETEVKNMLFCEGKKIFFPSREDRTRWLGMHCCSQKYKICKFYSEIMKNY